MNTLDINKIKRLIIKQITGEITPPEKQALNDWLVQSRGNEQLFKELSSGDFLEEAITDDHAREQTKVWNKIDRLTLKKRRTTIYRHLIRVAAVAAILLGVTLIYRTRETTSLPAPSLVQQDILPGTSKAIVELANGDKIVLNNDTTIQSMGTVIINRKDTLDIMKGAQPTGNITEYHTVRVPRGGEYVAKLDDGTIIHLNADSELRVPTAFATDSREVYFKGEGYFSVAKDTRRPFVIYSGEVDIKVLGTEFGVRSYASEEEIITTLVQGSVEIKQDRNVRRLSPNEQARVNKEGNITVSRVNVYSYIAWQSGRIAFENERLEYIMDELARWYDVEISYRNEHLKDLKFIIDIKKYSNLQELLSLMEKMNKVSFRIEDRTVIIGEQKEDSTANTILHSR